MKVVIGSDLHGSVEGTKSLLSAFYREKADVLALLGDLYYHGPRNPFPGEYQPANVADILNLVADKLIVVRGNCDSQVDEMISKFPFNDSATLLVGGRRVFLTHGHVYNQGNLPPIGCCDVLAHGHTHVNGIWRTEDAIVVNPGSVSLPKGGTEASYAVVDETAILVKALDGRLLHEFIFDKTAE